MSGSKGLKRYNGVEQDDEGAYVYYDEHIAALRRAKADGVREASGAAKKLANGVVPTAAMNALNLLGVELDARAAQIEEGE